MSEKSNKLVIYDLPGGAVAAGVVVAKHMHTLQITIKHGNDVRTTANECHSYKTILGVLTVSNYRYWNITVVQYMRTNYTVREKLANFKFILTINEN